ncbi:carboxymuconolactone decarboxylase family protein [Methyloceanibacter superfactus]|uniref:carboxymuconolactone decarboxylase family protein n=1 Tax=Methyloceanibacter superfactus TaxID=1774969 RepID=UPI003138F769
MPRIQPLDPAAADDRTKTLLDGVKKKLGTVPNFMKTMAHAPSSLAAYLAFSGAAAEGKLPVDLRERIALATAQTNGCDYCASLIRPWARWRAWTPARSRWASPVTPRTRKRKRRLPSPRRFWPSAAR